MKKTYIISLVFIIVLSLFFGWLYLTQHAWGTWGDDSAGYIYLWGLMDQGKPLVYQEDLTVQALDHFGDEKLARWTTPTHHEIISPSGYIASKYPIGLSLLMYLPGKINDAAIYLVLPLLALANLLLVYFIAQFIFKELAIKSPWKELLGLLAACVLGLSELYYNYAVAQPMREIPSIFFLLAGYLLLLYFIKHKKYLLFIGAVFLLAFGFNIRETSLIIALPAFLLLLTQKRDKKQWGKLVLITLVTFIIAISPSIYNSVQITKYKEKFKKKDISSVAITSNLDHISSFSLQNIFDNQGKFRPGRGALPHYWNIIQQMSGALFFMVFVFIGIAYLFKKNKWLAGSLMAWVLAFLVLFSMWVNPYSRYIMPIFPILAILGVYGLYVFINQILPKFLKNKKAINILGITIILALIISYIPILETIKTNLDEETYIFKAISHQDLDNLKDLGDNLDQEKDLVVFTGDWQFGISETFESHTGVQSIRMPFEQKKFTFDEVEVKEFFDKILPQYNIYIWIDSTTNETTNQFLQNYTLDTKYKYNFTFETEAVIYKLQ